MFYIILEEIMTEKNLKVADVARLCDLSDSTVRSIISRKSKTVALEVAFKIAKGLNVDINRLSGQTTNTTPTIDKSTLENIEQDLPAKLRFLRQKESISQKEMAKLINVQPNTYNQWENGKREPDYKTLAKIASFFNVTIDYLIGLTDKSNTEQENVAIIEENNLDNDKKNEVLFDEELVNTLIDKPNLKDLIKLANQLPPEGIYKLNDYLDMLMLQYKIPQPKLLNFLINKKKQPPSDK